MRIGLIALILALLGTAERNVREGIWIGRAEIQALPVNGAEWQRVKRAADQTAGIPELRNQSQRNNVLVLAKALVYARTGEASYRNDVIDQCMRVIGTEEGGTALALGRELAAYLIAADLVQLPPAEDVRFRTWLRTILDRPLESDTLRQTHERRPNNWGTHAGASRAAVARYLNDPEDLTRVAQVFKGWLGDRSSYSGFVYRDLDWQCDPRQPVGINPKGCTREGHSIDGVLPDDQRRSGGFSWPPPKENYVYEALQGALVQAHILHRAGYEAFEWQDRALLRAYTWLLDQARFPASGDDIWQLPVVDYHYNTTFWNPRFNPRPGKNLGWTGWTHFRHATEK
jgi:hypothetical protein